MNYLLVRLTLLVIAGFIAIQTVDAQSSPTNSKPFMIFDNMFYAGKPDFSSNGIVASCVVYETSEIRAAVTNGQLPDETAFKEKIKKVNDQKFDVKIN